MKPITFSEAADTFDGGLVAVARALGETVQTVSNWKNRGVPPNRCKAVERLLGISVKFLRPDDWRDYWPDQPCDQSTPTAEAAA